jgi:outer membrane immunogenic protein
MKKTLLAGMALLALAFGALPGAAADLQPVYKAPTITPSYYNWTGFYVGGHVGGAWADKSWTQTFPAGPAALGNGASFNADGFIGGGQIGYNWQMGAWVLGVEADASASGQSGSGVQAPFTAWTSSTDVNWFGTVTGRVGYSWDRVLVYGKGGLAWANEDHSQAFNGLPASSTSATPVGWTVGFGLEYAFSNNWSAKVEYNYIDLGKSNVGFANVGTPQPSNAFEIDQTMQVVKFGVNYRFNWGAPIVARY